MDGLIKKFSFSLFLHFFIFFAQDKSLLCMDNVPDEDIIIADAHKTTITTSTTSSFNGKKRGRPDGELSSTNTNNEIDQSISDVDSIYADLCQKLSIPSGKNILDKNEIDLSGKFGSFPINPNIQTPSINNIRFSHQQDNPSNLICNYINTDFYNALEKEIEYQKREYHVFYHGQPYGVTFYQDVYHFLYAWGQLDKNHPLALRAFIGNTYPQNISDFFIKFEQNANEIYYKDKHKIRLGNAYDDVCFDHDEDIIMQCLPVNLALYAREESSISYLQGNTAIAAGGIEEETRVYSEIIDLFKLLNIPNKFASDLVEIYKKHNLERRTPGKLLQIFIKNEYVNQTSYLSCTGGFPIFNDKLQVPKTSTILSGYIKDPNGLNEFLLNYPMNERLLDTAPVKEDNIFKLDLNKLQARLWLPANALHNANLTKIFRYTIGDLDLEYKKEIAKVFENIIKDRIERIKFGEIRSKKNITTPFSIFDKFVTNKIYEIFNQKINENRLTQQDVVSTANNFDLFYRLYPTLKNGLAMDSLYNETSLIAKNLAISPNPNSQKIALNLYILLFKKDLDLLNQ
jgi:hypothetical protein